jgi:hypothetical protein
MSCETKIKLVAGTLGYNAHTGQILHYDNPEALVAALAEQRQRPYAREMTKEDAFNLLASRTKGRGIDTKPLTQEERTKLVRFLSQTNGSSALLTQLAEKWGDGLTDTDHKELWRAITHDHFASLNALAGGIKIPEKYLPAVWSKVLNDGEMTQYLAEFDSTGAVQLSEEAREAVCRRLADFDPMRSAHLLNRNHPLSQSYIKSLWEAVAKDVEASVVAVSRKVLPEELPEFRDEAYRTIARSVPRGLRERDRGVEAVLYGAMRPTTPKQEEILAEGVLAQNGYRPSQSQYNGAVHDAMNTHYAVAQRVKNGDLGADDVETLTRMPGLAYDVLTYRQGKLANPNDAERLWRTVVKKHPDVLHYLYEKDLHSAYPPSKTLLAELRATALRQVEGVRAVAKGTRKPLGYLHPEILRAIARDPQASANLLRGIFDKGAGVAEIEVAPKQAAVVNAMVKRVLDTRGEDGLRELVATGKSSTTQDNFRYLRDRVKWSPKPVNLPQPVIVATEGE